MQCPTCNTSLPHEARFCLTCGQDLGIVTRVASRSNSESTSPQASGLSKWAWISLAAVAGILTTLIILLATVASDWLSQRAVTQNQPTATQPVPVSIPTPRTTPSPEPTLQPSPTPQPMRSIETPSPPAAPAPDNEVAQPRVIEPPTKATILRRQFHVSPGSYFAQEFHLNRYANVTGAFDSSSPIEVSISGRDGRVGIVYNSGRINTGTINLNLAQGDYYIVFNNKFSIITGKDVRAVLFAQ
jgi:hypothetical protein